MLDSTLAGLVDMTAETHEKLDYDIDEAGFEKLLAVAQEFEDAVEALLEPYASAHGVDLENLMDPSREGGSAAFNILMSLRGEGAGPWDGRWAHLFEADTIKAIEDEAREKLSHWADDTGCGRFNDALLDAIR